MRRALVWIALLTLAGLGSLAADWRTPGPGEGPETAPVRRFEGVPYVAVNDLARLLDATKFWRADVRRLVLRSGSHTIVLSDDNPFVVVDNRTLWLGSPVRSERGELQVPVVLVDSLPRDSTLARLTYDVRRARVVVLPASGRVSSPRLQVEDQVTRIVFPADRPEEAVVIARGRDHFRLRFGGWFVGALPDSFPKGSLVAAIRPIAAAAGSAFELTLTGEAAGYRLLRETSRRRVTLELAGELGPGFEPFAPEDPAGERRLRTVVIDPAHGGGDPGVTAGELLEKDLTLALAKRIEAELERSGARVVLTRDDDRQVSAEDRAQLANRMAADLVLTLHFDGYADPRSRGATAFCPPAEVGAGNPGSDLAAEAPGRLTLLPWREVSTRHAVQSRALAEAVLSALELRGQGPTRLRERLPYDLLGVNAPGILLECATLTSPIDRERVSQEEGLRQLAASIVEGIAAYRRNQ